MNKNKVGIKNRTPFYLDDMINIKDFFHIFLDQKSNQKILIFGVFVRNLCVLCLIK